VVPSQLQEPDRHIERTRAERRPGEAVALCSGCDQVAALAQPAKPVHRCEATAVRPVATDGAERLKTGEDIRAVDKSNRINVGTVRRSRCERQPWAVHVIGRCRQGIGPRGRRCFRGVPVRSSAFQYPRSDGSVDKFQSS